MLRFLLVLIVWIVLPTIRASAQASTPDSAPLLHTGITGTNTSTGLADPTVVLSFRSVQRVVLDAVAGPVDAGHVDSLLRGTPVTRAALVTLGMLRPQGDRHAVAYLVLTVDDQRAIYQVAKVYGPSLARAFESHRDDFDRLLQRYPRPELRTQLAFDLVARMR